MRQLASVVALAVSICFASHALTLEPRYEYDQPKILSTTLFPAASSEFELFTLNDERTSHRIPAQRIIEALALGGISAEAGKLRYITFEKKIPIDFTGLENALREYYAEHLPGLRIISVDITPRSFIDTLPEGYRVVFPPKMFRRDSGTFYLDAEGVPKTFFNFSVEGELRSVFVRGGISRDETLTAHNTEVRTVPFRGIRGETLCEVPANRYRARQPLRDGRQVLMRNIEPMPLVVRDKHLLASVKSGAVVIQFSARALQDGALHDIISIEKSDGQRLRAVVTGPNRVEVK